MNIGKILKEYRLRLGLTQMEMAEGVLTPSYYSKVERNAHRIAAEDLFLILQKHSINLTEFTSAVYRMESDHSKRFSALHYEMILYHYQGDQDALNNMYRKINENEELTTFESRTLKSLNDSLLYSLTNDRDFISEENIQFLKQQFFEAENWDSFKLTLYSNIMGIYDFESNHAIIKSLLRRNIEEYEAHHQMFILTILTNFISTCLINNHLSLAKHYNEIIISSPSNYDNVLQKIAGQYYTYLFAYIEEPNLENEKKALDFIDVFKEIDFGVHNQALELLENIKQIYVESDKERKKE